MSSPWAKIVTPEPVNLQDIMSEEVAKDLQEKEDRKYLDAVIGEFEIVEQDEFAIPPELLEEEEDEMLKSDAEIAKMLQQQFDKEHDENLRRSEKKFNGTSKISVSFSNYRRAPQNFDFESDAEEEEPEDLLDRKDWDRFDTVQREFAAIPSCGYKVNKDGSMVTKHDVAMNGRKNACKLMSFPPEFETGDGAEFDLKLSNKVFNSLKAHSKHEQARRQKIRDKKEDEATAEFGVDEFTRLLLYKMINNRLLERVNGVISIGKEAVVLHAECDSQYSKRILPKECCIKVFKTTLSEYKQREQYIRDDYRFKGRMGVKMNTRKVVHLWAEKEMHNLVRMQKAGVPCPEVIALNKHILVMSFIGKNNRPARKLKDTHFEDVDYILAYEQVVENMKNLYAKANLIHADLSEYNILWHNDTCYFIDVSQAVEPQHDNAFEFLMRDCMNVCNFFLRRGVPGVVMASTLFKEITGCDYGDKVHLTRLQEAVKLKPHMMGRPGYESAYHFDSAWEKSQCKILPQGAEIFANKIESSPCAEPVQA